MRIKHRGERFSPYFELCRMVILMINFKPNPLKTDYSMLEYLSNSGNLIAKSAIMDLEKSKAANGLVQVLRNVIKAGMEPFLQKFWVKPDQVEKTDRVIGGFENLKQVKTTYRKNKKSKVSHVIQHPLHSMDFMGYKISLYKDGSVDINKHHFDAEMLSDLPSLEYLAESEFKRYNWEAFLDHFDYKPNKSDTYDSEGYMRVGSSLSAYKLFGVLDKDGKIAFEPDQTDPQSLWGRWFHGMDYLSRSIVKAYTTALSYTINSFFRGLNAPLGSVEGLLAEGDVIEGDRVDFRQPFYEMLKRQNQWDDEDEEYQVEGFLRMPFRDSNAEAYALHKMGLYHTTDKAKYSAYVKKLDEAISQTEVTTPFITSRQISRYNTTNTANGESEPMDLLDMLMNAPGGILHEKGYCSTAMVPGVYDLSSSKSGMIKFNIKVPAGKGIGMWTGHLSDFPHANEFVLARGTKFRILTDLSKIDRNSKEITIDLEVVEGMQQDTEDVWNELTQKGLVFSSVDEAIKAGHQPPKGYKPFKVEG